MMVAGLLGATLTFGQNLSQHNWYFGNSTNGIRFNRASNKPFLVTNKAVPFGVGGSAVATDPSTADLLFYTDGNNVYDATHALMVGGTGLTGNSTANQPVAVCAIPGQTNKYFIFTNTANYITGGTISSTVVDMTLFGNSVFPSPPLGAVAGPAAAVPGLTNRSEGMVLVPHANGTDFWLITQQNSTANFSATLINAASFTSSTFTTTATSGIGLPITVANFAYFKKTKKMAVAPQGTNTDAEIFIFNDATGVFTFDRYIYNTGRPTTANQSIYDIEWDKKGQYLYLSRTGEAGFPADLIQYDYLNSNPGTPVTILTSVLITPVFRSYGLQLAPDSAIYYLYQASAGGPFLVDTFTKTDTIASAVKRKTTPLGASGFAGTQFPSFLPKGKVNLTADFTFNALPDCQNTPISFFPAIVPNADSLRWRFGDGTNATLWSPIHTFAKAQTFIVSLTAYYQGDSAVVSKSVVITAFSLKLKLVQDTTACRSEFPPPRGSSSPKQFSVKVSATGGSGTPSYVWSNGNTGATLKPDSAGYYYVIATDASGCSAYAGVNVKEYGLQDHRQNIWYFGNKAGIDFNVTPIKALNTSAMDAPEGCAIVCDRNGKVIFYTDGDNVYDKTNTVVASGIGGDPLATQSSLIFPVPGDETLYYIFTTQKINGTSNNELRYSLFDLKKPSGSQVTQKDILLFSKSTERITANSNWLIVHEYGNNTFRAYPVSAKGIGDPIYTAIGSDHSFQVPQNGEGYMKMGGKNDVAVALSNPGTSNFIELFHFHDSTGILTNYRKIDLKDPNGQVYGIEFSPGGNKLFATVKGTPTPSEIFEYSLDSLGRPHFKQQQTFAAELGAIQIAPNGQIYIAANDAANNGFLGTIASNEDTTKLSTFQLKSFPLAAGTNSRLGLPNFRQQVGNGFGGPGFTFTGVCVGDSTRFAGTATDAIDKFQWFFGDGGSSAQASPVHLYASAGTYTVSMHLTNRCSLDTTIVKQVTIFSPPPPPTVPGASALCNGPVVLNANTGNIPGMTYLWSNLDTTKIVTIKIPTFISVTNTDKHGCRSSALSIVADNRPQVNLGPDQTVCQNNNATPLDAKNPGATYVWKINGVNASTIQIQAVDTTVPGLFVYNVVVTDPITLCKVTSQTTFNVKVSPSFTMTGINPTGCGTATGTITITLNTSAPPAGPYSYFVTGPGGFNQQAIDQTAPVTKSFINQTAGTFSGVVTDQISGCTISNSFGLTDAPFTATALALAPNCDPVTVQITSNAVSLPLTYAATNNGTAQITSGSSATAVFNTTPLSAGTYTIQIKDNSVPGCIFTINNFVVAPAAPVNVTLTPNLCSSPPTIVASGATTYSWSAVPASGIVSGAGTSTIQLLPGAGMVTYTVTASSAGTCPNKQNITVVVNSVITPAFTQSDPCSPQVVLTATPIGNYIYRWYLDVSGVLQPTALVGQQTVVTTSGTYAIELTDPVSGCKVTSSPSQAVTVNGTLTGGITATQACDDNQPFTLTSTTNSVGVTYSWTLDGTTIAGETSATLSGTKAGLYEVTITKTPCKITAGLQILKAPIPVGKLPDSWVICNDPENNDPNTAKVDLDPGAFSHYNWFKNQLTVGDTLRVYTADSEGLYSVTLTNSFGCTAPDQTIVKNECIPKLVAPTAFRPSSNQGSNKDFYVFSFFIKTEDFQIYIYNRWGEMVYQSSDRYFKWNGNFNNAGQPLPGGTYAYVIKYVSSFDPGKGLQEKHGGVVLLR